MNAYVQAENYISEMLSYDTTAKLVELGDVNSQLSHDLVLQVFCGAKLVQHHWR
jgi:hypothetical protein